MRTQIVKEHIFTEDEIDSIYKKLIEIRSKLGELNTITDTIQSEVFFIDEGIRQIMYVINNPKE